MIYNFETDINHHRFKQRPFSLIFQNCIRQVIELPMYWSNQQIYVEKSMEMVTD